VVRVDEVKIGANCNDQYDHNKRDDLLSNPGELHSARLKK
jgi:hypothetical protein